jgi:hypothetical protein
MSQPEQTLEAVALARKLNDFRGRPAPPYLPPSKATIGETVVVPANAILRTLGRSTGKSQHDQLRADFKRLFEGSVVIKTKDFEYFGYLIDDALQDTREIVQKRHWAPVRPCSQEGAEEGRETVPLGTASGIHFACYPATLHGIRVRFCHSFSPFGPLASI